MKTKLLSVPDWGKVLNDIGFADAPSPSDIEARIVKELTRGKVTFEDAGSEPIEKGFRVAIRTQSSLPKFNKEKTTLTVGAGLYDPTVEERLVGMRAGESAEVAVKGEAVCLTVLKAERKHIPELTDEMAVELGIEGVDSLAAYRAFMAGKIRTAYASELGKKVLEKLVEHAAFSAICEEDITQVIDLEYAALNARFGLDKLSPEEWARDFGKVELKEYYEQIYPDVAMIFGTTGKESFYGSRKENAISAIKNSLVLQGILGSETDPTIEPKTESKLKEAFADQLINTVFGG